MFRNAIRSLYVLSVVFLFLLAASAGRAVPVDYTVEPSAEVDVTVLEGFTTQLATATVALQLTSTITVESVTEEIVGMDFILVGGTVLNLASPYGGYDTVTLDAVTVATGPSSSIARQTVGSVYTFVATDVEVTATYSASDSLGSTPPAPGQPISFMTNFNGVYDATTATVSMFAVTLGVVPGTAFGEAEDLIVTGDFNVEGGSGSLVPEPSAGLLIGVGLAFLATRRPRRAASASGCPGDRR